MITNVVYLVEIRTIVNVMMKLKLINIYEVYYIYYTLESSKDIAGNIAINDDKTSYISELTTTHLVLQDDVGMTILIDIDTDITNDDLLL